MLHGSMNRIENLMMAERKKKQENGEKKNHMFISRGVWTMQYTQWKSVQYVSGNKEIRFNSMAQKRIEW